MSVWRVVSVESVNLLERKGRLPIGRRLTTCPTKLHSRNQIEARSGRRNRGSDQRSALSQKAKDTLDTRLQPRRMASSRHEETRLKPHVQKSSRHGKKPRCSSTKPGRRFRLRENLCG